MSQTTVNRLMQAVAVLVVVYALILFNQGRQTSSGLARPADLAGLNTTADKLVVKSGTTTVELKREGPDWFIDKEPVKQEKAEALLSSLETLEFSRVVSEGGETAIDYGLEAGSKSIAIFQGQNELRRIEVGRSSGIDRFFARLGGESRIYEAEGGLAVLLDEPLSSWTSKDTSATGP